MRKLPHFRRNYDPNSGFTERVTWQLSKRAHTGRELSALFNMPLTEVNGLMQGCFRGSTAVVEKSDPVKVGHCTDYTYRLISTSRVTRSTPPSIVVSKKQCVHSSPADRQKNIEAAQRRARLIKAGLYPFCTE